MKKERKIQFVEEWSREIADVPHAVLVDYCGLTVTEVTELRRRMREADCVYRVVKNNLACRALPGTALEGLAEHFVGPCAVAYHREDPVALAKALVEFGRDNPALEVKVGVVGGRLLEADQIKQLSKTPAKAELLAMLAYMLQHPIRGFATALKNVVRNLAVVLDQVARSRE